MGTTRKSTGLSAIPLVRAVGFEPTTRISLLLPKQAEWTRLSDALTKDTTHHRENLQWAGNQIRTDDSYSAERYVSNYTIPAQWRLEWRPMTVSIRRILLDREVCYLYINGPNKTGNSLLLTAIVRIMVCCMFPNLGAVCRSCAHFAGLQNRNITDNAYTALFSEEGVGPDPKPFKTIIRISNPLLYPDRFTFHSI